MVEEMVYLAHRNILINLLFTGPWMCMGMVDVGGAWVWWMWEGHGDDGCGRGMRMGNYRI